MYNLKGKHMKNQIITLLFCLLISFQSSVSAAAKDNVCRVTTKFAFESCHAGVVSNYALALAACINEAEIVDRKTCERVSKAARSEGNSDCRDIREARNNICRDLGPAPYDPIIDPANFLTPAEIAASPNQFFPLIPGTVTKYKEGEDVITITVTNRTINLLGVTAIVVRDLDTLNGVTVEDTDDFFAQDKDGNVWYMGEISQSFEDGLLDSLEGSWRAGIAGAKPGIAMLGNRAVGDKYRQEFLLGVAEDFAKIISTTGTATAPAASCNGTCLVTEETNAREPDAKEQKYYAPGIGLILSVDLASGERMEITEITNP
jgi:hypothetical protein